MSDPSAQIAAFLFVTCGGLGAPSPPQVTPMPDETNYSPRDDAPLGGPSKEKTGSLVAFPRARLPKKARPSANNLPLELSSFIGRQREVAKVQRLLVGGTPCPSAQKPPSPPFAGAGRCRCRCRSRVLAPGVGPPPSVGRTSAFLRRYVSVIDNTTGLPMDLVGSSRHGLQAPRLPVGTCPLPFRSR